MSETGAATGPDRAGWTTIGVEAGDQSNPVIVRWSTWVPRGRGGQCYDAFALRTPVGWVLVDPVDPGPDAIERLESLIDREPVATLLTSAWHERAAYRARERYGPPVWAPRAGTAELEGRPDHLYDDGELLPGGLRAITVDHGFAGDSVLLWTAPTGERVLFSGDAILGELNPRDPRPDHWRRAPGLYLFLHGPGDRQRFQDAFRRLLDEEFDLILSAHSVVVRANGTSISGQTPKSALARLLDTGRVIERPMGYGIAVGLAGPAAP